MIQNVGINIDVVFYIKERQNDDRLADIGWEVNGQPQKIVLSHTESCCVYLIKDVNGNTIGYELNDKVFANQVNLLNYVKSNFKVYL